MFGAIAKAIVIPMVNGFADCIGAMLWSAMTIAFDIIDGMSRAIEWLAVDNWGKVLFGVDSQSGKLNFFPNTSSPLFYVWIVLLSFGILILILFIGIWGIKKIKGKHGLKEGEDISQQGVAMKVIVVSLSLFFIPFGIITGMSITRGVSQMVFPYKTETKDTTTGTLSGVFSSELTDMAQTLYDFPKTTPMAFDSNGNYEGLYSHTTKSGYQDVDWNSWLSQAQANNGTTIPFKNLQSIFSRLSLEITRFNSVAQLANVSQDILDITSGLTTSMNDWEKNWGESGIKDFKKVLENLSTYSSNSASGKKDEKTSSVIAEDKKIVKQFATDTFEMLSGFNNLLNQKDQMEIAMPYSSIALDTGLVDKPNILATLKEGSNEALDTEAYISINNISSIVNSYFKATNSVLGTSSWTTPFEAKTTPVSWADNKAPSLEEIGINSFILVNGFDGSGGKVSLYDLQQSYSNKKVLPLTILIYQVASGNKDKDVSNSPSGNSQTYIPKVALGMIMIFTTIMILGQVVKRIIQRFVKLGWLWIMGGVIVPSSITDGGGRFNVWISMVVTEMLWLFGFLSMWYLWKHLSIPVMDEVERIPNLSDMSRQVVKYFAITGFLELLVVGSDWFGEIIGANNLFGSADSAGMMGRKAGNYAKDRLTGKSTRSGMKKASAHGTKSRFLKQNGLKRSDMGITGMGKRGFANMKTWKANGFGSSIKGSGLVQGMKGLGGGLKGFFGGLGK